MPDQIVAISVTEEERAALVEMFEENAVDEDAYDHDFGYRILYALWEALPAETPA